MLDRYTTGPFLKQNEELIYLKSSKGHPLCQSAAVVVLKPDDIVQFGGGDFKQGGIFQGRHAVPGERANADSVARPGDGLDQLPIAALNFKEGFALIEVKSFILLLVMLEAEPLALLHKNQLSGIFRSMSPQQFKPPGLFSFLRELILHLN